MDTTLERLKVSGDDRDHDQDTNTTNYHMQTAERVPPPSQSASLDGLPAELKLSILRSVPNFVTLQSLARSSPSFHAVYLEERKTILPTVLLRDCGTEVFQDALAVNQASQLGYHDGSGESKLSTISFLPEYKARGKSGGRKDLVIKFLERYREERHSFDQLTIQALDLRALDSMSRLHSHVLRTTSDFCESTLPDDATQRVKSHLDISPNERRRIYRALYRFELFGVLFNIPLNVESTIDTNEWFDGMDRSFMFLRLFKPWEVEELGCVHDYMIKRLGEILKGCTSELSKLRPKKDFTDEFWIRDAVDYLESLGLPLLCRLLDACSPVQQATILKDKLYTSGPLLREALEQEPYDCVYYTDEYIAAHETGVQELIFENDNLVDGPNAGWTLNNNNVVSLWYYTGYDAPLRKWAFVMWDYSRLKNSGKLGLNPNEP